MYLSEFRVLVDFMRDAGLSVFMDSSLAASLQSIKTAHYLMPSCSILLYYPAASEVSQ